MKILIPLLLSAPLAAADPPVIQKVDTTRSGSGWSFQVTIFHADTGWEDYADGWRVLDNQGAVLGTRTLHHPHVNEQPFTRGLSGIQIPGDTKTVYVEASDSVGGWSGDPFQVALD